MNETKPKGLLPLFIRITAVLFGISTLLLMLYVASTLQVQASIRENLQPILQELKTDAATDTVEVAIYSEPDNYNLPWMVEYHVFLTAKVPDPHAMDAAQALAILNHGMASGNKEYRYAWDTMDHAIYTRTVTDSVTGRTHPVFVTLSDGNHHYSLVKSGYSDDNRLAKRDAYRVLLPPATNETMWITMLVTPGSAILLFLLLRKKRAIAAEVTRIAEENRPPELGIRNLLARIDRELAMEDQKKIWKKQP